MMKLYRAISPSMNDQWSGKTLPSCFLRYLAGGDAVVNPDVAGAAGLLNLAGAHPRSQKLGPTGWAKPWRAIKYPSSSTVIAS